MLCVVHACTFEVHDLVATGGSNFGAVAVAAAVEFQIWEAMRGTSNVFASDEDGEKIFFFVSIYQ